MKEKLRRFMTGRYGIDAYSRFLMALFFVLWFINLFAGKTSIYYLSSFVMLYMYFRIFSRNCVKRYNENLKYLQIKDKVIRRLRSEKSQMEQRKTHHIYKCPTCKQKIRVPRGKGRICITCPKCKTEFTKTS